MVMRLFLFEKIFRKLFILFLGNLDVWSELYKIFEIIKCKFFVFEIYLRFIGGGIGIKI